MWNSSKSQWPPVLLYHRVRQTEFLHIVLITSETIMNKQFVCVWGGGLQWNNLLQLIWKVCAVIIYVVGCERKTMGGFPYPCKIEKNLSKQKRPYVLWGGCFVTSGFDSLCQLHWISCLISARLIQWAVLLAGCKGTWLQLVFQHKRSLDLSCNLSSHKFLNNRQGKLETGSWPTAGDVMSILLYSSLWIFIVA